MFIAWLQIVLVAREFIAVILSLTQTNLPPDINLELIMPMQTVQDCINSVYICAAAI